MHVLIVVPGEPPRYHPRRPRSTSEAIAAMSRDDLRTTRSKDDHRAHTPSESHDGGERARTAASFSPPHQEDDLDLCPPAAGISSLDFDPMSFQCSPASATPGLQHNKDRIKWKKSVGCSSESELISSPNNNISCSPDISPVLAKSGRKASSKQLSPKLRKKSFKAQADVQFASASTPPPPPPSSSSPGEKREAPLADGKVQKAPYPHCSPLSTASQASALTDLSQSAQNLPDSGQHHT